MTPDLFSILFPAIAMLLLFTLGLGLVRIMRGPTVSDGMLASQLTTTTGVGFLVIMAEVLQLPSLVDVALVLALLGAVATIAFVRSGAARYSEKGD